MDLGFLPAARRPRSRLVVIAFGVVALSGCLAAREYHFLDVVSADPRASAPASFRRRSAPELGAVEPAACDESERSSSDCGWIDPDESDLLDPVDEGFEDLDDLDDDLADDILEDLDQNTDDELDDDN